MTFRKRMRQRVANCRLIYHIARIWRAIEGLNPWRMRGRGALIFVIVAAVVFGFTLVLQIEPAVESLGKLVDKLVDAYCRISTCSVHVAEPPRTLPEPPKPPAPAEVTKVPETGTDPPVVPRNPPQAEDRPKPDRRRQVGEQGSKPRPKQVAKAPPEWEPDVRRDLRRDPGGRMGIGNSPAACPPLEKFFDDLAVVFGSKPSCGTMP